MSAPHLRLIRFPQTRVRNRRRLPDPPAVPPFDTLTLGNRLQILAFMDPFMLYVIEKLVNLWAAQHGDFAAQRRDLDGVEALIDRCLKRAPEARWPYTERP